MGDGATTLPETIDSLWNYQDPAASEESFKTLLDQAVEAPEGYIVEILSQIARAQGLQQRFEDAHATLDDAEARLAESMTVGPVRVLLERGRAFNSSGEPERSVALFEQALALSEEAGLEYYAVDAAHMLGIVERGDRSITWNERALALAEAAADPRAQRWRGPIYNNLAWTYHDLGRYQDAQDLFEKDYRYRTGLEQPFQAGVARWSMAKMLRRQGRAAAALEIQRSLLEEPERRGNAAEGFTHEEIAECLLALDRADEATAHFAQAWQLLKDEPWLTRDEPERLARLRRLGGLD